MRRFSLILIVISLIGCSTLPERKPWTKWDKALGAFYLAGHTADAVSTERALDNPNNYELNPILGKHPSDTEIAVYMAGTSILVLIVADRVPKLRKPLLLIGGALGAGLAIHNSRLD